MKAWTKFSVLLAAAMASAAIAQPEPTAREGPGPGGPPVDARPDVRPPLGPPATGARRPPGAELPPGAPGERRVFITGDARQGGQALAEQRRAQQALAEQGVQYMLWEGHKEKAAFLGVSGSPVPPALREQLKLPKGVGLVVDFVEPKSPAAEAGLKQYDVLHKLGDQLLINAHQFAVLVRTHKIGDEVALTVISGGESKQVKAKLGEKEVMALDDGNPWGAAPNPFGGAAAGANVVIQRQPGVGINESPVPVLSRVPIVGRLFTKDVAGEMRWTDDEGSLVVTTDKSGRKLVAKSKDGKTLFDGPIDTPEQLKAVPPGVHEKLNRLEQSMPRPDLRTTTTRPWQGGQIDFVPGFGQPSVIQLQAAGEGQLPELQIINVPEERPAAE